MLGLRCVGFTAVILTVLASPARADDLFYTFEFRRQPSPVLQVDLRFRVSSGQAVDLVLPSKYGGDGEMWRWITDLRLVDGSAKLKADSSPERRTLEVFRSGWCMIDDMRIRSFTEQTQTTSPG